MNLPAKQESVLPPGYRLQVIWKDGLPETVPLGTNSTVPYLTGLPFRERIANKLTKLFCEEFGYEPHSRQTMTICADIDGNECVWVKGRIPPPPKKLIAPKKPLELGTDVIDI